MCLISFKKTTEKQNILFDEFFVEYNEISIICFNYDAQGAALCKCDGNLTAIDAHRLEKILFGVQTPSLTNYLTSIFDPNSHSDEIHKTGGELIFRSPELTKMKKYDRANLAKKTLKEVTDADTDTFIYFIEQQKSSCKSKLMPPTAASIEELFGNKKTLVLHKSSCPNFNPATCTENFTSTKDAQKAGFKPCGKCKP